MTEPEVRVRSTRRRRSEVPPAPPPSTPHVRNWLIYAGLTTLVGALMLDGFLRHRPPGPVLPALAQATEVRSAITQRGDSLRVVVSWDLTLADPAGRPESIGVTVVTTEPPESLFSIQSARQVADTVMLPAPAPGRTIAGVSCAAAWRPDEPQEKACTPWQYVRPSAVRTAAAAVAIRLVVEPSGLQVDPDVSGDCARWQEAHPAESVWLKVNTTAVAACTGPNQKPTVAQFCVFALLPDGRRVKTENSVNNPYCEELFEEWTLGNVS